MRFHFSVKNGIFIMNIKNYPDERGYFGRFGGQFVAETLMQAVLELKAAFDLNKNDESFWQEFSKILKNYVGRPSPLYLAERLTQKFGGAEIWLKREDLNHTGAHKINNAVGQALLAKRLGKRRIIAETGAGQHGVATATICAKMGLKCHIYMGEEDIKRQQPNVFRMKLLGAEVISVKSGSQTLKDAINEALRDWVSNIENTFYIIGTAAGPHPYPMIVREFQRVIGEEAKAQCLEEFNALPDEVVACVGGGSNAIGIFSAFYEDENTALTGVEAAGLGIETGKHSAPLTANSPTGILHGNRMPLMSDEEGQILDTYSISAGLDYPGVGPEHAFLKEQGRANYVAITDEEALDAFKQLCLYEGIIPALESSHALAYALKRAEELEKGKRIVVNLSGRGDKDINTIANFYGIKI